MKYIEQKNLSALPLPAPPRPAPTPPIHPLASTAAQQRNRITLPWLLCQPTCVSTVVSILCPSSPCAATVLGARNRAHAAYRPNHPMDALYTANHLTKVANASATSTPRPPAVHRSTYGQAGFNGRRKHLFCPVWQGPGRQARSPTRRVEI